MTTKFRVETDEDWIAWEPGQSLALEAGGVVVSKGLFELIKAARFQVNDRTSAAKKSAEEMEWPI